MSVLKAGVLTVNWRGQNESTIMLMIFAENSTDRGENLEEGLRMRGQRGPPLKS